LLASFSLSTNEFNNFLPARSDASYKWICTDGKDPATMGTKIYLEAFNKGPCSPLIVVPAMTAQRLTAEFICGDAKKNYSEVWGLCGWILPCWTKTILIYPPDYRWAATYLGQFGTFKSCYAKIIGPAVSYKEDGTPQYYEPKGLDVRPQWEGSYNFGQVERKESCGFRASNKILNGPSFISKLQVEYIADYWEDLAAMGYRANLTTFMFAYDWRLDSKTIVKKFKFRAMAEMLFHLTGKKIAVLTHSYG